ncbi:MAG: glucokinase [Desulfobulbaceae bacterium]|nr:glucokinase [Desulfobulbaceae bacterium]
MSKSEAPILAVDLGGSKCELAVYQPDGSFSGFVRLASRDFTNVLAILRRYQTEHPLPRHLALAVAGPVDGDNAHLTNLGWDVSGEEIRQTFGLELLYLCNDLTALCAAIPALPDDALVTLQAGKRRADAPAAVLAPGTGLGEGMLIMGDGYQRAIGGEGGHADFAPVNDEQIELLRSMRRRHRSVSYEMLVSGPGIARLFDYYRKTSGETPKAEVAVRLDAATDQTPVIIEAALAQDYCPLCRKTLNLFLEILGAEAGNLALKLYARNGLYLAGGVLPRLIGRISFAPFLAAFSNKTMMAALLATIPIHLVRHPHPVLVGAAQLAIAKQKQDG